MAITVSDYLGIDKQVFDKTNAFDVVLDVDSLFFIDPHLLKVTKAPELSKSHEKLEKRFASVLKLIKLSKRADDAFWREALRRFEFPELQGLCIGYSSKDTGGSGIGKTIRQQILRTAREIIEAGVDDPSIFEIIGLFEPDVGPDRISDMVGQIIIDDLYRFSHRVYSELAPMIESRPDIEFVAVNDFRILKNPFNRKPLLLVPKDILNELQVARDRSDVPYVAQFNDAVRRQLNETVGQTWRKVVRATKADIKKALLADGAAALKELLRRYKTAKPQPYDFERDRAGEVAWYDAAKRARASHPLRLSLSSTPTETDILTVIATICEHYKRLIEDHGLSSLLYDKLKPKRESAAQKLFFGIADAYCESNNLDISPEVNSGRGSVDFKVSYGYNSRVIVEVKKSTNPDLVHGFKVQLREYEKAEHTKASIYLVIKVSKQETMINQVRKLLSEADAKGRSAPRLIVIDAMPKAPASKY